jgi:hypothetical protein
MKIPAIPVLLLSALSVFSLQHCATKSTPSSSRARITDDTLLLDRVQRETFAYFWDGAEDVSGLAPERIHTDGVYEQNDSDVIASGGSGFGIMAMLVAIERGFVTRDEVVARLEKAVDFLEKAERFHGAWPHWMYNTGKPKPFSRKDDAGDIVETAYLAQGLLCARQYFGKGNAREKALASRLDQLWREIEWDWYRGPNQENVLFWHWSPKYGWQMNFRIEGYNECLITYVLAASSPTHSVPAEVYHEGWARSGAMVGSTTKYGRTLVLKHNGSPEYGGPLFWSHYSFLGLDPRKLKDRYADYWVHNVNHVMIDYHYCVENPKGYKGYGPDCWGLTSSYSIKGYSGHKPEEDLGVITPTAALASFPYAPKEAMAALQHFYHALGDEVIGAYGPYDAFSIHEDWYPQKYLAIDQGPIPVMIENYRSGLLWNLFMSCAEVQNGLTKLGFTY